MREDVAVEDGGRERDRHHGVGHVDEGGDVRLDGLSARRRETESELRDRKAQRREGRTAAERRRYACSSV